MDLPEWSDNLIFMAANSKSSSIRERFGYYDENGDGYVTNKELYRVIRANQIRWKGFETLWSKIDVTGDNWTDTSASEAHPGLKEVMGSDLS